MTDMILLADYLSRTMELAISDYATWTELLEQEVVGYPIDIGRDEPALTGYATPAYIQRFHDSFPVTSAIHDDGSCWKYYGQDGLEWIVLFDIRRQRV